MTQAPLTPEVLIAACTKAFPGVQLHVKDSVGRTAISFWVWHFEVLFTIVSQKVVFPEHLGDTWLEVRLRWPKARVQHQVKKDLNIRTLEEVTSSLKWLQEFFNGVAANILMSQVDRYEMPIDILGNGAKTDIS